MIAAANRWNKYIKFNSSIYSQIQGLVAGWNGIAVTAVTEYYDPFDGAIASCGINNYIDFPGQTVKFNSVSYFVNINTYYATEPGAFSPADWINVLTHELGHGIGIGIYWNAYFQSGGSVPPSADAFLSGTAYTQARGAYRTLLNNGSLNKIALEDAGGAGTASAHWEADYRISGGQAYPGFDNELMVGYFYSGLNSVISSLSIKTLVDFGYEEVNPGAVEGIPTLVSAISAKNNNRIKLNCSCSNIYRDMVHLGTLNNENI
jgi:hypothetical protein